MRPSKSPSRFTAIASKSDDRAAADVEASRISIASVQCGRCPNNNLLSEICRERSKSLRYELQCPHNIYMPKNLVLERALPRHLLQSRLGRTPRRHAFRRHHAMPMLPLQLATSSTFRKSCRGFIAFCWILKSRATQGFQRTVQDATSPL